MNEFQAERLIHFDFLTEPMPEGICRKCGHPFGEHIPNLGLDVRFDPCPHLAKPLTETGQASPKCPNDQCEFCPHPDRLLHIDVDKCYACGFEGGRQEGRKEVVDWITSHNAAPDQILDDWQAQLKEWGIE